MVANECHLTYTASHYGIWPAQPKDLRFLPCPTVVVTTMQPPMLEHELGEAMLVRGARQI